MKNLKRFSVAIVVLALCLFVCATAWAVDSNIVTCSADVSNPTACYSNEEQVVTVMLTTDKEIAATSITLTIDVPEGWEVVEDSIVLPEGGLLHYYAGNRRVLWFTSDAEDVAFETVIAFQVVIPAKEAAGEYEIGFTGIELAYNYATEYWNTAEEVYTTVEVLAPTACYEWSEDNSECTAALKCSVCGDISASETVKAASEVTTVATCSKAEVVVYTATFTAEWAQAQVKSVTGSVNAEAHAFPSEPTSYTQSDDGKTHTANYVCGNNSKHTKSDEPVEHTYDQEGDKCVCGAEKPASTVLKGDIDLDDDVDMDDLTYFAEHVAKIITITNVESLENAEVTNDGQVTMDDLTKLAEYIAKIIPSLD